MIVYKNVNSINEIEINKYDIYILLKKEYVLIQLFIKFSWLKTNKIALTCQLRNMHMIQTRMEIFMMYFVQKDHIICFKQF